MDAGGYAEGEEKIEHEKNPPGVAIDLCRPTLPLLPTADSL